MSIHRAQAHVVFHGLVVFLLGLLCGVPYGNAITEGWSETAVRGWQTAHLGLTAGGAWMLAAGAALPVVHASTATASRIVWAAVAANYGFVVGLCLPPLAGVRGLTPDGPVANLVAFAGNSIGALGSLLATSFMLAAAYRALRTAD